MAAYYLDTSALVKRYTREPGSTWIMGLMVRRAGQDLYTVRLSGPEAIAALTRKVHTGELTPADAAHSRRVFRRHWQRRLVAAQRRWQARRLRGTVAAYPVQLREQQSGWHHAWSQRISSTIL